MKTFHFFTALLLSLLAVSCGKEEDEPQGGHGGGQKPTEIEAPMSIVGKDLHFGPDDEHVFFSLMQLNEGVKVVMADGWKTDNAACEYELIGSDRSKLKISFDLNLGTGSIVRHYYDLEMLFVREHYGQYEGIHRYEFDGQTTEEEDSGFFGYDTGDTGIFEEEPVPDVNFSLLTRSWVSEGQDTTRYITFYDAEDAYLLVTKAQDYYQVEEGTYRIIPDAYLLSLLPEGSDQRTHYRVQTLNGNELAWISYLAALDEAVEPQHFVPSDTDGREAEELAEDVFFLQPSTVSSNSIRFNLRWKGGVYDLPNGGASVGICYGTSPHPQITDEVTEERVWVSDEQLEEDGRSSTYLDADGLQSGTTYYVRPFILVDGNPIYFEETEVETMGNHMQAELEKVGTDSEYRMRISYKIDQPGTYHVRLYHFSTIYGGVIREDYGYQTQGDSDSFTYTCRYTSGSVHDFQLQLVDIETGIAYLSNMISYRRR